MDSGSMIAVFLPLFIVFFIIFPTQQKNRTVTKILKKRRGEKKMTNELIKSCIGKVCTISTGSFGSSYSKVTIVDVVDNWIKIQGKSNTDMVNVDYITNIKVYDK